ncbi:MAG: HNH endonuclease [Burkholderiales bacterium]|nr:HNH endonuclease [Burkholderiales bacterium]
MPTRPLRPCAQPGCRELVPAGRCRAHARQQEQARGSHGARGYDRRWERVRALVLQAEPLCQVCQAEGRVTAANEVHHLVPIAVDPSRRLELANLQPLCKACHAAITARETHGARR